FSWLVVIGLIALSVLRARQGRKTRGTVTGIIIALVVAVLLNTVSAGLIFIQPQERGVVISAVAPDGYRQDLLEPGLRWVIPYAENVKTYSISKSTYTMSIAQLEGDVQGDDSIAARTEDGQEVYIDASIIFSLDPNDILAVHIIWQDRYLDGLIRPTIRGVIRDAVSQFKVNEVYSTRRDELKQEIETNMMKTMDDNGLILSDFVLRNITFTTEYAASIEKKQIAEQLAKEAEYVVEQRRQEAEQARQVAEGTRDSAIIEAEGRAQSQVIEAKAEAEALQLIANVLAQNPELLNYRYIEKLAPGIQVMLVPNDNPYILPLPEITP
ncbi:MAG: SPFH domain-containing protein, partial [Anaerolineales bacterium]|nr:SPFH domain-containing protein [Anaerolineales bacterium]